VAFGFLKKIAKDAVKIGPLAFIPGAGAAVVLATGVAAVGHTHAPIVRSVSATVNRLAQNPYVHAIAQGWSSGYMQANPAFFAKTLVLGAADETLHGQNLGKAILDQRKKVASWLTSKAQYASQAAGVPPQVTPALTAAAHIASGDPIPKNIVEVASGVLGATVGPEASDALEQGAALGHQLATAANATAAKGVMQAIAAAKDALPSAVKSPPPPAAATPAATVGKLSLKHVFGSIKHAFDAGVAFAAAQHLQSKGFAAAQELLPPASDGSDSIAGKVADALAAPAGDLLAPAIANVQSQLPPEAQGLVQETLKKVVTTPADAALSSTDLAAKHGIPEPVARVVLASVSHEVPGAPIVHPQRAAALVGPPPAAAAAREGAAA
jgi:hypothetical protein